MEGTSLNVTDFDNLPQGMSLYLSNGTRNGNIVSCNDQRLVFEINYHNEEALFPVGSVLEMGIQITSWTQRYIRAYWRGQKVNTWGTSSGNAMWSIVQGMRAPSGIDPIGSDANTAVRNDTATTVILKMVFTQNCWGFELNFGAVGYDWAGAQGTGSFELLYLTTQYQALDPYSAAGNTGIGGGLKPYDPFDTDDIDYEALPEVSAVGTGFISLWCPDEQQMLDLSGYMWNSDPLTIDFWRKLVANPIELVYGLNIIPLDLRDMGIVGATPDKVVVGNISTDIEMDYLTSQWVELDCGTIDIDEKILGSYLDYDPFTKVDIYLPYIGYRPLRIDDIMPGEIQLKYRIDLLTGACVAQIKSTKSHEHDDELNSIIYQFMGNCATQVPVTASQYADAVRAAITAAAAVGTMAALAGTATPAMAAMPDLMPTGDTAMLGPASGSLVPVNSSIGLSDAAFAQIHSVSSDLGTAKASGGNPLKSIGQMHSAASAGSNVMSIKPSIQRSGTISGAAGMLSLQTPYLVFTRPRLAHPEDQNTYMGYPSFMTQQLNTLTGFTQMQVIHLEGIPCTTTELAELEALLKSGVIF